MHFVVKIGIDRTPKFRPVVKLVIASNNSLWLKSFTVSSKLFTLSLPHFQRHSLLLITHLAICLILDLLFPNSTFCPHNSIPYNAIILFLLPCTFIYSRCVLLEIASKHSAVAMLSLFRQISPLVCD